MIESAGMRILCILLFEPICNLYEIPAGVLRGSGHAIYPAVSTMIGTCAFRIVWICTTFRANPTLPMLYQAFPLSWVATVLLVNTGGVIIAYLEKRKKNASWDLLILELKPKVSSRLLSNAMMEVLKDRLKND